MEIFRFGHRDNRTLWFWSTFHTEPFSYSASNEDYCIGKYYSVYTITFSYEHSMEIFRFGHRDNRTLWFWSTFHTEPFSYSASNEDYCIGKYYSVYTITFSYEHSMEIFRFGHRDNRTLWFWSTFHTEPFSYSASNEDYCIGKYYSVYTKTFSYEHSMEMFRFGLPSTLNRFIIRHQMKTIA